MNPVAQWLAAALTRIQMLPFAVLAAAAFPLVVLSAYRRTYPNWPLVLAALAPVLLSLALLGSASDVVLAVIFGIDLAVILLAAVDLFTLPSEKSLRCERQTMRIASLQKPHRVSLQISNLSAASFRLRIRDDAPEAFDARPAEFEQRLAGRSRALLHYDLYARQRGMFHLESIHVRSVSRMGLWQRYFSFPAPSSISVYPDLKQLGEYALLARTNRLSLVGVRRTRKVGQDNDFERLRDYTPDDNYKHLDWRATARRNKLTVKDFQTSQSQRVIFLIDCGRMMTNTAAGLSLLDHAMNAMLMLSYVALAQGDSTGLVFFSDQIHSSIPPKGSHKQMNRLLHAAHDRFPRLVESRYDEVFLHLSTHCRKRSLVVLITNVIDEVNANQLQSYLTNLVGQHLPLGVLLRDRGLFEAAEKPQPRGLDLYRAGAAAEILTWRHHLLSDLEHKGVLTLDVYPERLTAPLVNAYLNIKARHLL